MATGVVSWSTTAANNATADANVNEAEGMAPSAVNDSARAIMASVAKWRDDNNASLATGGTSTAYTLTTNQGFASLTAMNRQSIRVFFNATCGASPTLNVDGLGAKAICTSIGTPIGTGTLIANRAYDLVYDNSNSCWVLCGGEKEFEFASGTGILFFQAAAPTGWTQNVGINDFALRVTSGTGGGTAGVTPFTSVFAARTIGQVNLPNYALTSTLAVTAASTGISAVTHANYLVDAGSTGAGGGLNRLSTSVSNLIDVTDPTHTHSLTGSVTLGGSSTPLDFNVLYANVIICNKA